MADRVPATLPVGVRDYPPALAEPFYRLQATLVETFCSSGYQNVMTPAFELAHVFELGLGPDAAARVLRFVDPQNGDVLALRSDITPQIARMVCGPMKDAELPIRLCYFGRVFRLREHADWQRREVAQAGIELIGVDGPAADAEVVSLCDAALAAAVVDSDHVISIGHAGLVSSVLEGLDRGSEIRHLIARKDMDSLPDLLHGVPADRRTAVAALPTLYGEPMDVLKRARAISALPSTPLDELEATVAALGGVHGRIQLDLGEMLGFGYYTGLVFQAWLPGVGQAVAAGGRYNTLLERYGRDLPAAGFALDEEGLTVAQQGKN